MTKVIFCGQDQMSHHLRATSFCQFTRPLQLTPRIPRRQSIDDQQKLNTGSSVTKKFFFELKPMKAIVQRFYDKVFPKLVGMWHLKR